MRKTFMALAMVFVLAASSHAEGVNVVDLPSSGIPSFTPTYSLGKAITATGTGSSVWFSYYGSYAIPIAKHMCTATWGGMSNPSQVVFYIECSEDGTNFGTGSNACASVTMTSSPYIFHIDKPGVRFLRRNIVSFTDGTSPSLTLTCSSGGI